MVVMDWIVIRLSTKCIYFFFFFFINDERYLQNILCQGTCVVGGKRGEGWAPIVTIQIHIFCFFFFTFRRNSAAVVISFFFFLFILFSFFRRFSPGCPISIKKIVVHRIELVTVPVLFSFCSRENERREGGEVTGE